MIGVLPGHPAHSATAGILLWEPSTRTRALRARGGRASDRGRRRSPPRCHRPPFGRPDDRATFAARLRLDLGGPRRTEGRPIAGARERSSNPSRLATVCSRESQLAALRGGASRELLRVRRRPRGADVVLGDVHGRAVAPSDARRGRSRLPVQLGGPSFLDLSLPVQVGGPVAIKSGASAWVFPTRESLGAHGATSARTVARATASRRCSPNWREPRRFAAPWRSAGGSGGASTVAGARGPRPATRCRRFRTRRCRDRAGRGATARGARAPAG